MQPRGRQTRSRIHTSVNVARPEVLQRSLRTERQGKARQGKAVAMSSGAVMNGGGGSSADVWSRGTKRAADESNFTDLERFEKRLRMLSLRTPLQLKSH